MNDFIMCALNKARKGYIHQSEIDKIFEELNFLSKSSYEYAPVKFEEVNADGLYILVKYELKYELSQTLFEYLYSNMLFGTISKNQDNNSDTEVNSNGR